MKKKSVLAVIVLLCMAIDVSAQALPQTSQTNLDGLIGAIGSRGPLYMARSKVHNYLILYARITWGCSYWIIQLKPIDPHMGKPQEVTFLTEVSGKITTYHIKGLEVIQVVTDKETCYVVNFETDTARGIKLCFP